MIDLDTDNQALADTVERAQAFLATPPQKRATDDWCRYLRDDRDSRTFFDATPMTRSTVFSVKVAEAVAKAYLACAEAKDVEAAPTVAQVRKLQASAFAFEADLDSAGSWVVADRSDPAFREPLRRICAAPSRVPPRAAGRLPLADRRAFVLHLAQSLYVLSGGFPTKFLMVAGVLAWEETSDRTIRQILTPAVRETIIAQAAIDRAASIAGENATHLLINRVSVKSVSNQSGAVDNRRDDEKVAEAVRLLGALTDRTAATVMVAMVMEQANEFGIVPTAL
ncbi:hypothetical protein [Burkholderia sp. Tr-20390]|uniref:hypothetical protein n=1 Tax=Burkholderia sp. Tr-20390 TaxID=2703904 RepID=UPI00197FD829|nr:hypothetical protein [Burkholderia sp. Tr-20390]MBN3729540.1 hypothetical protein [Burkholderia sp. Tr-20390]